MEAIKIDLINGYDHLKAFYYQNENGSIFTCKDTKTPMLKAAFAFLFQSNYIFQHCCFHM
jgi:hypothetical protein